MVDGNELNVNLKKKEKKNGVENKVSKPKKTRSTCMNKKRKKERARQGKKYTLALDSSSNMGRVAEVSSLCLDCQRRMRCMHMLS